MLKFGAWISLLCILVISSASASGVTVRDTFNVTRSLSFADRGVPANDDDEIAPSDTAAGDKTGSTTTEAASPYVIPVDSSPKTSDGSPPKDKKPQTKTVAPNSSNATANTDSNSTLHVNSTVTASNTTDLTTNSTTTSNATATNKTKEKEDDDSASTDDDSEAGDIPNFSQWNQTKNNQAQQNKNATISIPKEADQPDSWPYMVGGLFAVLAAILCSLAGFRACRQRKNRAGYEEIQSLIV